MSKTFSYTPGYQDHFFQTSGGQRLGIQGKEAQRLAFYMLTNPYFDISGDYRLPLNHLCAETGFERKVLKNLFSTLRASHFCTYDFRKQRVQVPVVAQIFTQLFKESERLGSGVRTESE